MKSWMHKLALAPAWLRDGSKLVGWIALGALLVVAVLTSHYYGNGRHAFAQHWGTPDQVLSFGEAKLYVFCLALGMPAAICFSNALRLLPWQRLFPAGDAPAESRWSLVVPALFAATGAFLIAKYVIQWAHFTDDEQAYVFQAHLYAQGKLTSPIIEPQLAFGHSFVVPVRPIDGVPQWSGTYPVLQPALMALSSFFGRLHWSQFICVGLLTYNAGRLAQRLFADKYVGLVTAWLCALSPMLLGLGSTHHTSVLSATLTVGGARALLACFDRGGVLPGLLLGAAVGALVLTRPMEGAYCVVLSSAAMAWLVISALRCGDRAKRNRGLATLGGFVLGGLPALAVFVSVNLHLTGHPLKGAYSILEERIGRFFGFGEKVMWGRAHNWTTGLVQTVTAFVRVNAFMFGWPVSFSFVLVALTRPFRSRTVLVLLALLLVHISGYFFLAFGSVHDFGHAYHVWHLPWVAAITASVLVRGARTGAGDDWGLLPRRFASLAAGMALFAVSAFWPAELVRWGDVAKIVRAPIEAAQSAVGERRAIVLWSQIQAPGTQASWVFLAPSPLPDAPILWARDHSAYYPMLARNFPDRDFFKLHWEAGKPVVRPFTLPGHARQKATHGKAAERKTAPVAPGSSR